MNIILAQELGKLVARAKFAADNPSLESKFKFWEDLPSEKKAMLLDLSKQHSLGVSDVSLTVQDQ